MPRRSGSIASNVSCNAKFKEAEAIDMPQLS